MTAIERALGRPLTTDQKATAGFIAALVILLISALASQQSTRRLVRDADWVSHTHDVIATIDALESGVADVEAGEGGFLLTGNERFLDRYRAAARRLDGELRALRTLTDDNAAQRARVAELAPVVEGELSSVARSVDLRRQPGFDVAAAAPRVELERPVVERIMALAAALKSEEWRLLDERTAQERQSVSITVIVSALGFLLTFVVAGLATMIIRRDVAERRRAEAEALRAKEVAETANRTKSAFMATMSHELRTPLNSVIGFTRVLMKNKSGKLDRIELSYLESIHANGKHLLNLINDVLDLSKIEASKVALEVAPVLIGQLVTETVAYFREDQVGKRVVLRAELPERVAPIETDAGKLKQVLINLIGNALKFTEHGTVTVRLMVDPETSRPFRIDVADSGIGIAADRLEAIFEAFEQADRGTARQYGGTGLGLTISRSLCHLMGHVLEVTSEVGRGTTFSIMLASDLALTPRWVRRVSATPPVNAAIVGAPATR